MSRLSACLWFMVQSLWSTHHTASLKSPANILCSAAASQALTAKNSRCQVLLEALGSWLMHLEASECLRIDAPKNRFSLVLPHGAQAGLIFCVRKDRKVWKEQNKSMGIWSKAKKRPKNAKLPSPSNRDIALRLPWQDIQSIIHEHSLSISWCSMVWTCLTDCATAQSNAAPLRWRCSVRVHFIKLCLIKFLVIIRNGRTCHWREPSSDCYGIFSPHLIHAINAILYRTL